MFREQHRIVIAILLMVLFGFVACGSSPDKPNRLISKDTVTIPMTPQLIEEFGPENMARVSYFLSKEVKLERQDTAKQQIQFDKGVAYRIDKSVTDVIVIDKETPGVAALNMLTESAHINYRVLGILFEDSSTNKLGFAVDLGDPEGKFGILFDNNEDGLIRYGNYMYRVVYKGEERPYLMVKIGKNILTESLSRKASGRKIE